MQELRAFWLPQKAPESRTLLDKPSQETLCPASGRKLRFKDLTILNFTRPPPGDSDACYAIDPVSHDALTNSHQMVVLKPTGDASGLRGHCTGSVFLSGRGPLVSGVLCSFSGERGGVGAHDCSPWRAGCVWGTACMTGYCCRVCLEEG